VSAPIDDLLRRPGEKRRRGRPAKVETLADGVMIGVWTIAHQRGHGCRWKCAWGHAEEHFGVGRRRVRDAVKAVQQHEQAHGVPRYPEFRGADSE
jgi:hypothetical protein